MFRLQEKRLALGSTAFLCIITKETYKSSSIFSKLWRAVDEFEQTFSRFRSKSELSYVNIMAGQKTTTSPEFIDFIKSSIEMANKSNGLFNPLVLPTLQKIGYLGSWPNVNENIDAINFCNRIIGKVEDIKIGKDWIYLPKNSAIDSGGAGKGYLLDRLSDIIENEGLYNYWFSIGGDLICSGNDLDKIGWNIDIQSATKVNSICDSISTNGKKVGIATSGVTKRRGTKNKHSWHHIVDPKTGKPAKSDILTVTIVAKNALLADICAKSIVIIGSADAQTFVKKMKIEMAIIQTKGSDMSLKIHGENHGK